MEVLFVADEPGRGALNAERGREMPFEPGLFVKLAARRFERSLPGLDLAADRESGGEALVLDEEDTTVVAREDRDGKGSALHGWRYFHQKPSSYPSSERDAS